MLKYFVSTHRTQGERDNDFNNTRDAEIVDLASLSHEDPDNAYCGCARSFVGIHSRQATTTAEIIETDMTPVQFVRRFYAALVGIGLPDSAELRGDRSAAGGSTVAGRHRRRTPMPRDPRTQPSRRNLSGPHRSRPAPRLKEPSCPVPPTRGAPARSSSTRPSPPAQYSRATSPRSASADDVITAIDKADAAELEATVPAGEAGER
ncbi:hypothetical protein VA596_47300 [Amycolatopsis sp., V23-08]|uniref:DUF7715 domain-containing protein n=1 Tax=Amycolatopsis heterodermiae TaxID=3110235 RepID=A0ABU5RPH1_9PSEU|nr:hypothetical protein [Amycolatopsis sp., V23-08]MEA5367206.1 hypothetical protein [Amycolatopsis sp., V23-08]